MMTPLLLASLLSFVAQVDIDVERIDDDTGSMMIDGEEPINMVINEALVSPDELVSARHDQTGDGKFDLMDVRAIQIMNGDPATGWKPRVDEAGAPIRPMHTMSARAAAYWECYPGVYFMDDITFKYRNLLTVVVRDATGHVLRAYQDPSWIIWVKYPADLEVTIEIDVVTKKLRVKPTPDGVEYSIVVGERQ